MLTFGSSPADMTPPVIISLIQSAPYLNSRRISRRSPSGPSAIRVGVSMWRSAIRLLKSPWPPVAEIACGATSNRGPSCWPRAMACFKSTVP